MSSRDNGPTIVSQYSRVLPSVFMHKHLIVAFAPRLGSVLVVRDGTCCSETIHRVRRPDRQGSWPSFFSAVYDYDSSTTSSSQHHSMFKHKVVPVPLRLPRAAGTTRSRNTISKRSVLIVLHVLDQDLDPDILLCLSRLGLSELQDIVAVDSFGGFHNRFLGYCAAMSFEGRTVGGFLLYFTQGNRFWYTTSTSIS